MGKIARLAVASVLFVAACADDEFAPPRIDAPNGCGDCDAPNDSPDPDASTDASTDATPIDARIDAASTVTIVQCPGNPDLEISAATSAFVPMTSTISVNNVVRFTPGSPNHNMVSGTGGVADGNFATPTGQTTCLRFTAAGTFPFYCSVHGFTGTITVQ